VSKKDLEEAQTRFPSFSFSSLPSVRRTEENEENKAGRRGIWIRRSRDLHTPVVLRSAVIAAEPVTQVRKSVSEDWTLRESARAKIKVMVKRILKKHGYPPDLQAEVTRPFWRRPSWCAPSGWRNERLPQLPTARGPQVEEAWRARVRGVLRKSVLNWRQRAGARARVRLAIENLPDNSLPRAYAKPLYEEKGAVLFEHVHECCPGEGHSADTNRDPGSFRLTSGCGVTRLRAK
jgi:hypothetical protein